MAKASELTDKGLRSIARRRVLDACWSNAHVRVMAAELLAAREVIRKADAMYVAQGEALRATLGQAGALDAADAADRAEAEYRAAVAHYNRIVG